MADYKSRNARKRRPILGCFIALGIVGVGVLAMLVGAWIAFEMGTRAWAS